MVNITFIIGSTRPQRFGPTAAAWLNEIATAYAGKARFEIVDLKEVNLPLFDEPLPPLMDQYTHSHTKDWAKLIDQADGFVMITPEYNHSMPAALKNAIDFLSKEWRYKPVAFLSYGAEAGGTRAVEHLRPVAGLLDMFDISEHVTMPSYYNHLDDAKHFLATEQQVQSAKAMLERLIFWAEHMKPAREALAAPNM